MKITQKGAELFHPQFSVSRLHTKFHALRKSRPQSVKLKLSQSDYDRPRNNSAPGLQPNGHLIRSNKNYSKKRGGIVSHQVFNVKTPN